MSSKHTPGPWMFQKTETGDIAIKGADHRKTRWARIATIGEVERQCVHREEMREANAALIAAAPELLAACDAIGFAEEAWADVVAKLNEFGLAAPAAVAVVFEMGRNAARKARGGK